MAAVSALLAGGWAALGGGPDVDVDGSWVLEAGSTTAGPLAVPPTAHVVLTFDGDSLGGTGPCNDYGGRYDLDGSAFDLSGPGVEMTFAGCDGAPGSLESAYLSALADVDTLERDGDVLVMTGDGVELQLRLEPPWPRADIVDRRWQLVAWTDELGVEHAPRWVDGRRPFVRFDDSGPVDASTGCRVLAGRWDEWRGAPAVTEAEWSGTCPDRLMDQEMVIGSALGEPFLELRGRGDAAELVVRYAHASSPARAVYR